MFYYRFKEPPQGPIYDWLLKNKTQILEGNAEFNGIPVSETTRFFQFKYTVSILWVTLVFTTPHFLPNPANNQLRFAPLRYSLTSACLGWWCFPWGPIFTLHSLIVNLSGGSSSTAGRLLQLLEWGWDAPGDVSATAHTKDLVELSSRAVEEIRSRRVSGKFPDNVGIRIKPTKFADAEVEISFDYPVSDGRDWIDESQGLTVLIDKDDEAQVSGSEIQFENGHFMISPGGLRPAT